MTELIARIVAVVLLSVLWLLIVLRCVKAGDRFNALVTRIRGRRVESCPKEELPPITQNRDQLGGETPWTRVKADGTLDTRSISALPDMETEKLYPYYNRTGQIICNSKNRTLNDLYTGEWYGYAQWLQDIISGKTDPAYIEPEPVSLEKGDKK